MITLKDIEKKLPDPYVLIIVALILTALVNASSFGHVTVILSMILAAVVAQIVDIAITYLKAKKFIYSHSATIAALILANIVMPGQFLLIGILCAAAMVLKHIIRFEKKPVFNPASSAMFVVPLIFAAAALSTTPVESNFLGWGNGTLQNLLATAVIVIFGLLVAIKIRRLAASVTYLVAYSLVTFLTAGAGALAVYVPFFGAFFMVTEPRTSPAKAKHQVIFGLAIVLLPFVFLMVVPIYYAFSLAFLSANALKIGLEKSNV